MTSPPNDRRYAGFWTRAAARVIDVLIILTVYNLFYLVDRLGADRGLWGASGFGEGEMGNAFSVDNFLRGVFFLGFPIFYYVYLTGSCGQTFGKMALKVKVINEDGSPIDYRKAMLRWLSYFLCDLTLNIGYIWAAFDPRKQGFHDKVCRTVVVKVNGNAAPPATPSGPGPGAGTTEPPSPSPPPAIGPNSSPPLQHPGN